uniref:Uncharacterized protein n=1 Tax=Candidatus Kentrum sp. FM TaxID=2126340 RepID=A0A450WCW3_9GAMM|nr:MAG: hypothetical protein BECKFM1743A_GA0114220_103401 [Candidatus Kentron sp. FM]VFJ76081.1 MAG: hypothetical protein BECKFM1743C_GA0114222_109081 [Candidatus Kentron sp. FM]VFK14880.1 MAG: hypothetical protein BECKFM1743B_GA0114221_103441 [Candidatus Kentron sp. FM]
MRLRAVRDLERIPANYMNKLVNTGDIWEIRIDIDTNSFRLLGFFHRRELARPRLRPTRHDPVLVKRP